MMLYIKKIVGPGEPARYWRKAVNHHNWNKPLMKIQFSKNISLRVRS